MQKLKLQNIWDNQTKSFLKDQFHLRESDKVISGRVALSNKKDDQWISKDMPFIAFKSQITDSTRIALTQSNGKLFDAEFTIIVDEFTDKEGQVKKYFKVNILNASLLNAPTQNNTQPAVDDEIPF
jgi:hypothetical protein